MFGKKKDSVDTALLTNHVYLEHQKQMLIAKIFGVVMGTGAMSMGGTLLMMCYWSLTHDMKDIAIVIGLAGTIGGTMIGGVIGYMVPSALQNSARRQNDNQPQVIAQNVETVNTATDEKGESK